ncbi:MAG: O-antigen ligase family protein [Desulfobacterales bacterium]|nr:O-antigen ligase family protein [Desulfobacterales bacterium]
MFDLSTAQFVQLIAALGLGVLVFIFSVAGLYRKLFNLVIITLPFQFISSRFGTLNMAFIFVVGISVFLGRKGEKDPGRFLIPVSSCLFLVGMAYALSFFNNPRPLLVLQVTYLIGLFSSVVLFYTTYRLINREDELHQFFKLLLIMNVLVLGYCVLQVIAGFTQIVPFGIQEFAFVKNRLHAAIDERRLTGPFSGPGLLAEYFVLMVFIQSYYLMATGRMKRIVIPVLFGNLCAMVGTGNRGAPIAMVIGLFIFIFLFRRQLGPAKILKFMVVGILLSAAASVIMLRYTQFNVLYDRFADTEIQGFTPDTRRGWPEYIKRALETPILGKGVRMILVSDLYDEKGRKKVSGVPASAAMGYPHSLYIYLFYTLGMVGLLAYALLAVCLYACFFNMSRVRTDSRFVEGIPRLAIVVLTVFCIDQFKIEFLRHTYSDYQQFLAATLAMFLASNKIAAREKPGDKHDG